MVKYRIIPKLLLKGGRNVKGVRFEDLRDTGHPVSNAKIFEAMDVDELIFLDIEASTEGRGTLIRTIEKASEEIFMPFCVGGGVRSVADIRELLNSGADKVSINTALLETPDLAERAASQFGSQCVVAAVDYREEGGRARVYTHGGRQATDREAFDHACEMVRRGAGEILLTSIDRDGTREGYDIELLRRVADAVEVPVIASGGAGSLQHLADAIELGHASAVSVGSLFNFTDQSPIKARAFMRVRGIEVRSDL